VRPFWKFAKPDGPGFGLSKQFYLSVLAGKPVLPSVAEVLNPKGEAGALKGFGVPLVAGKDKDLLVQPMLRGGYALASYDRKTVLKLMVMNADEAGFSPEAIAKSKIADQLDPMLLTKMRSTWHLLQISIESFDPEVYPALDFILGITHKISVLSDGLIADPISERYLFPHQLFQQPRIDPKVDAREHIYVHSRPYQGGSRVYTKGLFKFLQPELELMGVGDVSIVKAKELLMSVCQGVLQGHLVQNGSRVGEFEARQGIAEPRFWDGIPVYELLPPTKMSVEEAIQRSLA
jgi:hypothetical protein